MRVSRSRLIAVAVAMLGIVGGLLAAGSFASTARPVAQRAPLPLVRSLPRGFAVPAAPRRAATGSAQRTFVSAGSGNDANPCTRTAPCRNFQAAIAQTASGGEVIVLDSGGYGQVTINQAVSLIAPPGIYAGISVFGSGGMGTGITVNAGPSDVVTIRGLTLNGQGGAFGIIFSTGAALYVEDSVFNNLPTDCILATATASASVVIQDSLFTRCSGQAVDLNTSAGTIQGTIEHSRFEDGFNGVVGEQGSNIVIRDSIATGNSDVGFSANAVGAQVDVENSLVTRNNFGLIVASGADMRVSETTIEENNTGLAKFGTGTIASFGNNRLAGNTTNGSFSSTIPLQ